MKNFVGSICLSDIPKEFIKTGKNGKKYLDIFIGERQAPSQYGDTHFIKVSIPRDQKQVGVDYFIGGARELVPRAVDDLPEATNTTPAFEPLPF